MGNHHSDSAGSVVLQHPHYQPSGYSSSIGEIFSTAARGKSITDSNQRLADNKLTTNDHFVRKSADNSGSFGYAGCRQRIALLRIDELRNLRRRSVPSMGLLRERRESDGCDEEEAEEDEMERQFSTDRRNNFGNHQEQFVEMKLCKNTVTKQQFRVNNVKALSTNNSPANRRRHERLSRLYEECRQTPATPLQDGMPQIQVNGGFPPPLPPLSSLSSSDGARERSFDAADRPSTSRAPVTDRMDNCWEKEDESASFVLQSVRETSEFVERQKQRAQKVDSRKITAHRRLERGVHPHNSSNRHDATAAAPPSSSATNRRRYNYYLSSGGGDGGFAARSLDEAGGSHAHFATDLQRAMMKPLSVCNRNSPLKQMRTYSYRSVPSEENVLTKEHGEAIRRSWRLANERIAKFGAHRCFGFFVLEKVFQKAPDLRRLFGVEDGQTIFDVPDDHSFVRHTRIFNSIIDLAVRNVDELETEIAPALFTYGKRHYQPKLREAFNEESVRMFCAEIVHVMLELLGDELTAEELDAWIEMVRYMGTALLSGFEYERLATRKKISINTKQHAYFVL